MTIQVLGNLRSVVLLTVAAVGLAACGDNGSAATAASSSAMSTATVSASSASVSSDSSKTGSASSGGTSSASSGSSTPSKTAGPLPPVSSGTATLDWTPPTENTDGTELTNLAGYKVHYGTTAQNLDSTIEVSNPGLSSYTVTDLPSGTYYFAVTAVSSSGEESPLSGVVTASL
jgi:hypothetical protein